MDQRRLVERARRGDHDAFAELARGAVVRLDKVARLILRDSELARDAVQEGLIRAWRDLPKLRDPDRFEAWLHRLVVNSCIDQTRRRRRRVIEVELTALHAPSVADATGALVDRELVDVVMRHLDANGRAIVVLHYYVGLPLSEVATTLGLPIGTIKSRLHRALGEMRTAAADGAGSAASTFWVVTPDGGAARRLDGEYRLISGVDWSPLGDAIAVSHTDRGVGTITLVPADGSAATTLDIGVSATEAKWRPGTDGQLSFRGRDDHGWGQFLVERDGSGLTRLVLTTEGMFETEWDFRNAAWSTDGRRMLYDSLHTVRAGNGSGLRIHIAEIGPADDVLADSRFDFDDTADDELNARWLPDDRIVYQQRLGNEAVGIRNSLRIGFVATGDAQSIDLGVASSGDQGIGYEVSPDGRELVAITWTEGKTYRSDLTAYTTTAAPFSSDSGAIWQRVAVP